VSDSLTWSAMGVICGPVTTAQCMAAIRQGELGHRFPDVRRTVFSRESFTFGSVFAVGLVVLDHQLTGAPQMLASAWLAVAGGQLMLVDWVCHRLPTRLVVALFGGGVAIFSGAAVHGDETAAFARAVLAAAVVFTAALTTALVTPRSLGAGDVRLLGAVALFLGWFGWPQVLRGIVFALLLGATVGTVLLATKRISRGDHLAFGPAIVGGALLTLVMP